nr:LicD family protein [Lachnospiraceae bacterium]
LPRDKALEDEQMDSLRVCYTAYKDKEWLAENGPTIAEYATKLGEYKAAIRWLEKTCQVQFSEENPSEYELAVLYEEISGLYGDEDSDYITQVACIGVGMDYYIPKDVYASSTRMPFENTTIPVPAGYDLLLRKKYGDDYMTPVQASAGHEYPFYNAFIRAIFDERKHKTFEGAVEYIENISSKYYLKFKTKTTEAYVEISDEQLKEEVIEGKKITSEQKSKLAAQCEVLKEFERLCKIIDIPYYAVGDTLNKVVSKNYYAGDEDAVYVAIKRENLNDYLLKIGQELDPWYNYSCIYSSDQCEDMRIRIWSDSYMCDKDEFAKRFHGCEQEISVYIAVIDVVSDDDAREATRKMLIENLITTSNSMPSKPPYSEEVLGIVDEWKRIAQVNVNTETNLRREFLRAADNIAGGLQGEEAKQVRLTADLQQGIDTIYDKEWFEETVELPFAWTTVEAPCGYEEIVKKG